MSPGVSADRGPWIDLHSHAGRCFLAGLPAEHSMVASLGAAAVAGAVRDARAAGMTALVLATVSDLAVLRPDPVTGLRAGRDFRPGEALADHRRQLDGLRSAVAAAGAQVATSAAEVDRAAATAAPWCSLAVRAATSSTVTCGGLRKPARPASPCSRWCTTGSMRSVT
jgi:hypothetical protein